MLVTVLTFLALIAVIAYFAISKKQSKLEEYDIPTQQSEIKHMIAEVDPIVFEEEPTPEPIVEPKQKKAATKKTASKKPTVKKTKAAKKDGK